MKDSTKEEIYDSLEHFEGNVVCKKDAQYEISENLILELRKTPSCSRQSRTFPRYS